MGSDRVGDHEGGAEVRRHDARRGFGLSVAAAGGFAGFYALLAVIPTAAADLGGRATAGLATAALMVTTVSGQLLMPRLSARWSARRLLVTSLLLLGAPSLLYGSVSTSGPLLVLTAVRGLGFGVFTVVSAAAIVAWSPPGRQGATIGWYGLLTSGVGMVAPSLGIDLLLDGRGTTAFALAAAGPLLGAAALVLGVPSIRPEEHRPYAEVARSPDLVRPLLVFFPAAAAYGAVYSFLPLHHPDRASAGLLLFGAAAAVARFALGPLTARLRRGALGPALVALGAVALAAVAWGDGPVLPVALVVAGISLGGLATASLVTTVDRLRADEYALASGVWNLTFDSGMGLGALAFGVVAGLLGPAAVFVGAAAAVTAGLPLAVRDRRPPPVGAAGSSEPRSASPPG